MRVFAIADLHLPGGQGKTMDVFGAHWRGHPQRIAADWDDHVDADDIVLLAGDLSWAMHLAQAADDLAWLAARPGTKILVRGNHDYWWQSIGKVRRTLPAGCVALQNDAWVSDNGLLAVAGTRLWDVPGLCQGNIFDAPPCSESTMRARHKDAQADAQDEKIFNRELGRLEMSLDKLPASAVHRVAMLHYPPTNCSFHGTAVTSLLERYRITHCVFGHLHGVKHNVSFTGQRGAVSYALVSADYARFRLVKILDGNGTTASPRSSRDGYAGSDPLKL